MRVFRYYIGLCVRVCVCVLEVGVCACVDTCMHKYTRTCRCMYYMSSVYEHSSTTYSAENITLTETLTPITTEDFTKPAGPKVPIPRSAKEIFFIFFTPTLLELIVEQTSKYAAECMGLEKYEKWNKVTVDELCAYMRFMLLMGIVHLPSIYDYWKNDEVYHYSLVADKISRNRFHEIHHSSTLPTIVRYHHQGVQTTVSWVRSGQWQRSCLIVLLLSTSPLFSRIAINCLRLL